MNKSEMMHLIEHAKSGDVEAFAQIYNMYFYSVYYLALKMTRNVSDAEDIVQDTMIQLHKNIEKAADIRSLDAYVNRVAYNCTINFIRKRGDFLLDEDSEIILENLPEDGKDYIPHESVENRETKQVIIDLIGHLNETLKPVIILFYYHRLSIKQIAQILDIRESAVKKRLVRGREALKKQLEKGNRREGVFGMIPLPALTKILIEDARASCTDQVKCEIWSNICQQLNFSEAAIASTIPIIMKSGAIRPPYYIAKPRSPIAPLSIGAAAVIVAVGLIYTNKPVEVSKSLSGIVSSLASPSGNFPAPFESDFDGDISAPEAASSGADSPAGVVPSVDPQVGESAGGGPSDSVVVRSSPTPLISPPSSSGGGAVVRSSPGTGGSGETGETGRSSSPPEASAPSGAVKNVFPSLKIKQNILYYQRGAPLTAEQLIADAGAEATDRNGASILLEVSGLETVNNSSAGLYSVVIQTVNHEPLLRMEVIVLIEENLEENEESGYDN